MTSASPSRPPEVLLFDSGVGGLSIGQNLRHRLPGVHLSFLADNAGFPYGNQPEDVVIRRTVQLVTEQLARRPADIVVVACNTASTVALPALRAVVPVPVIGVVPAVKPAAALSVNRRIGLLATPATIRRPYLDQLIREFAADCSVIRVGQPDLVHWIERWARGAELPEEALAATLLPLNEAQVDTVVLGCTHYPLIGETFRRLLPEVRYWVDSGDAIARRAESLLLQKGRAVSELKRALTGDAHVCLFSGDTPQGVDAFLERLGFLTTQSGPGLTQQPEPASGPAG